MIAVPLPRTWLSLGRYAHIMGINPLSFYGTVATNSSGDYVVSNSACSEIWYQYDWQDTDKVSRTALALAIQDAERDLLAVLGSPLAPTWYVEEVHPYPKHHRAEYGSWYNAGGSRKGVITDYCPVISPGRRGVTLIGSVSPVYSDEDSDGFFETATVSVATSLTDPNEIKVYTYDQDGDEEWEIRPCRRKYIESGTFTAVFYTWQFIDLDLWEHFPIAGENAYEIDISGNPPSNVVSTVDVYREYNDTTQASVQFLWTQRCDSDYCTDTGCLACGLTTQDGCFDVRNAAIGEIVPWPGTYDSTNAEWDAADFSVSAEPDMVKLWYFAGEYNQRFLAGNFYDSLSDKWARVIARLATSRLSKPICSCGNLTSLYEYLSEDLADRRGDRSTVLDFDVLSNPFGTRRGEIEAWRYVCKAKGSSVQGAAL